VHERQNARDCLIRIHDHVKQAAGWVHRRGSLALSSISDGIRMGMPSPPHRSYHMHNNCSTKDRALSLKDSSISERMGIGIAVVNVTLCNRKLQTF
jgi:hypothetical protein